MNLRFVWHIFKKDLRRLWWMVALTLLLLARLAHFDSLRGNATPGTGEGWLNILLPLAWSFLIALALMEDPVVNDTPFWATVPCPWSSLLAAKAVLVAIVIHVPYFLACAWILDARGFAPSANLPDLLYRQFALLALTSASLALATVVGNVTQFMVVAIALATGLAAPSMRLDLNPGADLHIRETLALPIVTVAACWIAICQYWLRRTSPSRPMGIAAVLIVAGIWWSPPQQFYGMEAVMSPAPATAGEVSVRLVDQAVPPDTIRGHLLPLKFGMASVAVPIVVSGLRDNTHARLIDPGLTLLDANGNRYQAEAVFGRPNTIGCCRNLIPFWQLLSIDTVAYERIKDQPAKLQGRMFVDYYRPTGPFGTSIGKTTSVDEVGRCSADLPTPDNPNDENLRVECESPGRLPSVLVKLFDPEGNREWSGYLGNARSLIAYPTGTWLSPIDRRETFFGLTDEEHYSSSGGHWQVPREIIESIRIAITPEMPEGSSLIHFELPNLKLSQYAVKP